VENKQYCNLSREQASLYEAVVQDVETQLQESEGIQRQGLMLSTLMKLKQICNHPAQFLQDNSPFESSRSHKLERLSDMLTEMLSEGESALVFTQFTEIGSQLERHCWRRLKTDQLYRSKIDQGKLCFSVHHRIRLVDPTAVVLMPFLIESQF
jgi:SNF2 family DNA or RNA helicase